MKQARTIVNNLREKLYKQPPLTNLQFSIWERGEYGEDDSLCGYYPSYRYSPEDFASILFDLSIAGYYVRFVESLIYDYDYTIEMWLGLSERRKTNIDASVIQEVVKIAEKTSKPH